MPRKAKSIKKRPAPYRASRSRSSTTNSESASVIDAASGLASGHIVAATSAGATLPDASATNDISPGPVAPAGFPIFRLPRELRDLIYEYTDMLPLGQFIEARLLRGEKVFNNNNHVRNPPNSKKVPFTSAWNRPSLLRVCSQMRHEVLDLFFTENLISFYDGSAAPYHRYFEESAWFRLAKVGSRARGPEIQPPRQIQSLWKDALANLRRVHIKIRQGAVMKPEWFSSAMKHASRLSVVSLGIINRRGWDPELRLDAYCAAFNKIESLRELKLVYGFQQEDIEAISKKVSCSVKTLCDCLLENKGGRVGETLVSVLRGCEDSRPTDVILGCYFTTQLMKREVLKKWWHARGGSFTVSKEEYTSDGLRRKRLVTMYCTEASRRLNEA